MNTSLLRGALLGNAAFSLTCGLSFAAFPALLAAWLGDVPPLLLFFVGVGLVLFAAYAGWTAARVSDRFGHALAISVADLGWVAGSLALLASAGASLSPEGRVATAAVAVAVGSFGGLQLAGLRASTRNRRGRTAARSRFALRQILDASPDAVWAIVRDLGRIDEFYPVLRSVHVAGAGVGARRTCESHAGTRWSEEVTAWDEAARAFTLRFAAEAPDFPFPVTAMHGGWEVSARDDGRSDVVVWYEYTVRGGVLGEILAPLVAMRSRPGLAATLSRMEAAARTHPPQTHGHPAPLQGQL